MENLLEAIDTKRDHPFGKRWTEKEVERLNEICSDFAEHGQWIDGTHKAIKKENFAAMVRAVQTDSKLLAMRGRVLTDEGDKNSDQI